MEWVRVKPLPKGRRAHTATLLADGRVLVVGGSRGVTPVAPSCIFDPSTRTWSDAAPPAHPRAEHAAVRLADGRVLIAGGRSKVSLVRPAELYDPEADAWEPAGEIQADRVSPAMFAWGAEVLLFGGNGLSDLQAERWIDGAWRAGPPSPRRFWSHDAAQLPRGDVLQLAGSVGRGVDLWSWEASTSAWQASGRHLVTRGYATATTLLDGRVLIAGGADPGPPALSHATCEVWDPSTRRCEPTGSLASAHVGHRATLLPSGRVLVTAGNSSSWPAAFTASCELWDPSTGAWSPAGHLAHPVSEHTATLLASGEVLVCGGGAGATPVNSAQLWRE